MLPHRRVTQYDAGINNHGLSRMFAFDEMRLECGILNTRSSMCFVLATDTSLVAILYPVNVSIIPDFHEIQRDG